MTENNEMINSQDKNVGKWLDSMKDMIYNIYNTLQPQTENKFEFDSTSLPESEPIQKTLSQLYQMYKKISKRRKKKKSKLKKSTKSQFRNLDVIYI